MVSSTLVAMRYCVMLPPYALVTYSRVRVSTRMTSPGSMKSGTWMVAPVSSDGRLGAAGNGVALDAGGGIDDLEIDEGGQLHVERLVVDVDHVHFHVERHQVEPALEHALGKRELLVGLGVHEHDLVRLVVQILHRPALGAELLELLLGPERAVDDVAGRHVLAAWCGRKRRPCPASRAGTRRCGRYLPRT